MAQGKRATLKDVARASGVSPATVSFVLNDTPGQTIPEATRSRVQEAARSLDYSPHRLARALRTGNSRVVLLKLGDLRPGHSMDGFVRGMRHELGLHGHTLAVHPGGADDALLAEFVATLAPRAVVDLAGAYRDEDDVAGDGGWTDGLAAHTRTQLAYLADRGHTDIALAMPAEAAAEPLVRLRERYARQAWSELGRAGLHLVRVGSAPDEAARAVRDLRGGRPSVTAVAAFDDETALRVLAAITDLGLTAPADLAVIGFDDGPYGALWRPALTTVHIDGEAFGRRAARAALGIDPEGWESPVSSVVQRATA